jgi:hypothetical protein
MKSDKEITIEACQMFDKSEPGERAGFIHGARWMREHAKAENDRLRAELDAERKKTPPLPMDEDIIRNSQGAADRRSFIHGARWAIEYILRMMKTSK